MTVDKIIELILMAHTPETVSLAKAVRDKFLERNSTNDFTQLWDAGESLLMAEYCFEEPLPNAETLTMEQLYSAPETKDRKDIKHWAKNRNLICEAIEYLHGK